MARIRTTEAKSEKLMEVFVEVALPRDGTSDPFILHTYPQDYSNKEILTNVPFFAYPCAFKCTAVANFSFVLTNINSKWTYGYCRHTPNSDTCLVILSDLPWHSSFYQILNHCAELMNRPSSMSLNNFLQALYNNEVPEPGLQMNISYTIEGMKLQNFQAQCPDHLKPSIPEDRNLTEYYNAVSANNMIAIFASMLSERRIVITSERLYRLSACVQAANSLIFPMQWQHIFIPLLPSHLLDYLSAPMPFLIGVPQVTLAKVKRSELGNEVVLLNVDTNELSSPFDDVSTLPSEVLNNLRKSIKQSNNAIGNELCRSFMKALVSLIGSYHEALQVKPGQKIVFDSDKFVSSVRGTSRQLFLEKVLHLQMFQQFIETRLEYLNRGENYIDEFELELKEFETNRSFMTQYWEWTATMKKEGGAFLRAVNPKVRSAISMSRQAVRNFRLKIQTPGGQTKFNGGNPRPTSAPSSPNQVPKMKKTMSGTAISQNSRTVITGMPQPMRSNVPGGSSTRSTNLINSQNSSRKSTQSGMSTGAPIESTDVGESDFRQMPRVDMNITEELENIFRKKMPTKSNQNILTFTNNESIVSPPIPPPRTDKLNLNSRVPLKLPLTTSQTLLQQPQSADKCLIEFDSPPRNGNSSKDQNLSPLDAMVFDPLFDKSFNGTTDMSTNSPRYSNSSNNKAFDNYWSTNSNNNNNNNFFNCNGLNNHGINSGHSSIQTNYNNNISVPGGIQSMNNFNSHHQNLSVFNTPGLPTTPSSVYNFDKLSLQTRASQAQSVSTTPIQAQSNVSRPFINHWQQFD